MEREGSFNVCSKTHCKTASGLLQVDRVFKTKFEGILKKLEERDLITLKYKNKEAKIFRKE
jgi:hypothetical protein